MTAANDDAARGSTFPSSVVIGVLATITMDAAFVAASRLGGEAFTTDKIGPELVGRWAGGLARGRWRHDDIAAEPGLRGEAAIGLATHYATGVALTYAYLLALRRLGRRPGAVTATAYGAATALLPFLIMYPSWGYGCCGRRSGDAARMARVMLLGHTVFGAGIGVWASTGRWSPRPRKQASPLTSSS
jgi:hypothetical protein